MSQNAFRHRDGRSFAGGEGQQRRNGRCQPSTTTPPALQTRMRSASLRDDDIVWPLRFKEPANLLRIHRLDTTEQLDPRARLDPEDCYQIATTLARLGPANPCPRAKSDDGRYWARTSDLRLVEAALSQLS
jgi:hypothetical protein